MSPVFSPLDGFEVAAGAVSGAKYSSMEISVGAEWDSAHSWLSSD